MTTIQTYLYTKKIEVQFWDPTVFVTRNYQVYTRPVTVYQGVDNPLNVVIKNQDQKPANLTGYVVQADLQDVRNTTTVTSLAIRWVDITRGFGVIIFDRDLVNNLDQRMYTITFKKTKIGDAASTPMYSDLDQTVPIDIHVHPAYYSTTNTSTDIDIIIDGGTM